jgi:hypothetical protein
MIDRELARKKQKQTQRGKKRQGQKQAFIAPFGDSRMKASAQGLEADERGRPWLCILIDCLID